MTHTKTHTKTADRHITAKMAGLSGRAAAATATAAAVLVACGGAALAAAPSGAPAAGPASGPAPVTSTPDPSGQPMPVGNLPGWRQVFSDDFTENVPLGTFPAAVSSKWDAYNNGWKDTSGNGTYEPSQVVSIHDGIMDLYLHSKNGIHMVAAPVPIIPGATGPDGGMTYGRYDVRFKSDPVPGYKTAWLLWPDSNNWSEGEIDFPEGSVNSTISAFMHHRGNPQQQDAFPTSYTYGSWHTATTEWTPNSVTFLMDGKVVGVSSNKSVIPNTPMHYVLQTETNIGGGAPSNSAAGHVDIDWVSIYAQQS